MELGGKPRPKKKKTTGMDLPFFILILLLLGIGLIMLFSASYVQAINDTKLRSEERRVGKECRL